MATLITISIKQQGGSYKKYTIAVYDEADKYGNNVAMYEEQSKEERESKAKKNYLGNGRVIWTNGIVKLAPTKDQPKQINSEVVNEEKENNSNPTENFIYADKLHNEEVDDLPF